MFDVVGLTPPEVRSELNTEEVSGELRLLQPGGLHACWSPRGAERNPTVSFVP